MHFYDDSEIKLHIRGCVLCLPIEKYRNIGIYDKYGKVIDLDIKTAQIIARFILSKYLPEEE